MTSFSIILVALFVLCSVQQAEAQFFRNFLPKLPSFPSLPSFNNPGANQSGGFLSGLSNIGNQINNVVGGLGNAIGGVTMGINNAVGGINNAVGGVTMGINNAVGNINNAVGGVTMGVNNAIGGINNAVGGVTMGLNNAISGVTNRLGGLIPRIPQIPSLQGIIPQIPNVGNLIPQLPNLGNVIPQIPQIPNLGAGLQNIIPQIGGNNQQLPGTGGLPNVPPLGNVNQPGQVQPPQQMAVGQNGGPGSTGQPCVGEPNGSICNQACGAGQVEVRGNGLCSAGNKCCATGADRCAPINGVCATLSTCQAANGRTQSLLCPGSNNIKCCLPPGQQQNAQAGAIVQPGSASLVFPLASGSLSSIRQNWGGRRSSGTRCHAGQDLFTTRPGVAIAVDAGTVTAIFNFLTCQDGWAGPGATKAILVFHPSIGQTINYGEVDSSKISVRVGQSVTKGQIIGRAGHCGMLHFELYSGRRTSNLRWYPPRGENSGSGSDTQDKCARLFQSTIPNGLLDPRPFISNLRGNQITVNSAGRFLYEDDPDDAILDDNAATSTTASLLVASVVVLAASLF